MGLVIRQYKPTDYVMISQWWLRADKKAPSPQGMPPESTFIAEIDGVPALSLTLLLTNSKDFAILGNFIANPDVDRNERHKATPELLKFFEVFAQRLGYRSLLGVTQSPKLANYYETFGYSVVKDGVTVMKGIN